MPRLALLMALACCLGTSACSSCRREPPPSEQEPAVEESARDEPTAVSTAATGVEACDDYIRAAARCLETLEADAQAGLRESVSQYRAQVDEAETDAAKQSLAIGCEVALSSLREEHDCASEP